MSVKLRPYQNIILYGDDYNRVRDFLIELDSSIYHFGAWDWMLMFFSAGVEWADSSGLEKMGIWEDNGKIVAITTYDTNPNDAFILTLKGYEKLRQEMFFHAKQNLAKDRDFRVLIPDGDLEIQDIVFQNGFYPTQNKGSVGIYPIDTGKIQHTLPSGFRITSFNEDFDLYRYGQVLWKGFNHEINGEGPFYLYWEKHSEGYKKEWDRPNVDLNLKIFVVAPNGDFVSHCGMCIIKDQKVL
jgi:hypothetical protein